MPSWASSSIIWWTSAFERTSMPRVGSSRISTRGRVLSHLLRTIFCWLPPDSVDTGALTDAARILSRSLNAAAVASSSRRWTIPKRFEVARQRRQRDVRRDRLGEDQPEVVAVLGRVGDAVARAPRGTPDRDRLVVDPDLAGVGGSDPEQGQADVGPSRADESGEAERPRRPGPRTRRRRRRLRVRGRGPRAPPARVRSASAMNSCSSGLPTMSRIAVSAVASPVGRVEIQRPSRRTVTRSAISKTSSIRCEMNRIATPSARSDRMIRKRRSASWAESDAVGSSMIRTRTLSEIALAISRVCCSAGVRPRAGSSTSRRTPSLSKHGLGVTAHPPPVDECGRGRDAR